MSKELSEMTLEELWELFPIILTEHREIWSSWYNQEEEALKKLLPSGSVARISHVGSTAIPGIWAKPIIDILVELKDGHDRDMEQISELLCRTGWICMSRGEHRMSFNKGYTAHGFAEKVFHLHLRYEGDNDELYFRDYLLKHPETAKAYETLKLRLWKQYEHDRDAYTDAKTDFVKKYTEEARKQKKLYLIGGPMGVGKTTTGQALKKALDRCVFLDGDWCWDMDPFQVTPETKEMVLENICTLLNNYLRCTAYENVVFCWVMHEQAIIDEIMSRLNHTQHCKIIKLSLVCSEDALRSRLEKDIASGLREEDVRARSLMYLPLYNGLDTVKIDVSGKSTEQIVKEIQEKSI